MSRGPRHAHLVALITKPISRNKSAPSHRHVSHAVRWNRLLCYRRLHGPEHLLLTALPQGLVSPWSRTTTAHFTPHSPVTFPQAASPVLFAWVTLSSVVKGPAIAESTGQGSWESRCSLQNAHWPAELGMNPPAAGEMRWDNIWENAKGYTAVTEESWCM